MERARITERTTGKGQARFDVKWRPDGRGGKDLSRTFATLKDAQKFARMLVFYDSPRSPSILEPDTVIRRKPKGETKRQTKQELEAEGPRLQELLERLVKMKEALGRSPSTLRNYKDRSGYLKPLLHRRVGTITTAELNDFLARVKLERGAYVVHRVQEVLRQLFRLAYEEELIEKNPMDRAQKYKAPSGDAPEMLSQDEYRRLAAEIPEKEKAAFYLMSVLGMRHGEVDGLMAEDLAEDFSTLTIRRAWKQTVGFSSPKTEKSKRTLVVPGFIRPYLAARTPNPKDGRLFHTNHNWAPRVLYPACERAKVRKLKPHNLRDHAASTLLRNGLDLGSVSRQLGHAHPDITANRYIAVLSDASERAADLMESLLGDRNPEA